MSKKEAKKVKEDQPVPDMVGQTSTEFSQATTGGAPMPPDQPQGNVATPNDLPTPEPAKEVTEEETRRMLESLKEMGFTPQEGLGPIQGAQAMLQEYIEFQGKVKQAHGLYLNARVIARKAQREYDSKRVALKRTHDSMMADKEHFKITGKNDPERNGQLYALTKEASDEVDQLRLAFEESAWQEAHARAVLDSVKDIMRVMDLFRS
jgi:hypothetical protein